MIYKHKNLNLKNIITTTMLLLAFFCTAFLGIAITPSKVFAAGKQPLSSISNANFENHTNARPGVPNSWTFLTENSDTDDFIHGVFVNENYDNHNEEDYKLPENPFKQTGLPAELEVKKSLMLNSNKGAYLAGYESSSFTLEAGGFYSVSVYALAQNAHGSIYINGLSENQEQANIKTIINENWLQYTIFIATSEFSEEVVTLQLYLGEKDLTTTSSGAMFFADVVLMKYSQSTFNLELQNAKPETTTSVILTEPKTIAVDNGDFEDTLGQDSDNRIIPGFKTLNSEDSIFAENTLQIIEANSTSDLLSSLNVFAPFTNNSPNNQNVLFMHNKTVSYQGIESSDITIKRHTNYKLSVWAKSNSGASTGATLKLYQQNVAELENFTEISKSLTTSTSEVEKSVTNNWSQYSFYIKGHPLQDTVVNLQILLGTEETPTDGYVFIDQIEIQAITSSQYEKGVSNSNTTEFSYTENVNQFSIENGHFNLLYNAESTPTYPSVPQNWTISLLTEDTNEDEILSGVVSTTNSDFEMVENKSASNGLKAVNPGLTPRLNINNHTTETMPNNVLMMGQTSQAKQTAKSGEFSLEAKSIYKITFTANTQLSNTSNRDGASIALLSQGAPFFELLNINTEGSWKNHSIYIKTNQQITTIIELTLNNVTGYVFFDEFRLDTATEQEFLNAQDDKVNSFVLNLQEEQFNNHTHNSNQTLNNPFNWEATASENNSSVMFGILNTNKLANSEFSNINNPQPTHGENVLFARTIEDDIISLTTSTVYTLSAGSYNKVIVRVKTEGIGQEEKNRVLDSNNNPILPGVKIKLNTHQEAFYAVNTSELNSTNVNNWIDFEFYIMADTDLEIKPEISLGYENASTSGMLFVDTIKVVEMQQEEYTAEVTNLDNSKTKLLLTELVVDEDEEVADDPKFESANFDFVLVSSIIMSVALIFALLATALRRIKITRKPKIKTSYDRKRTLELEMNKKERISFRREIIDNLQEEFNLIDEEIREFITENDNKLEELKQKHQRKASKYESVKQAIVLEIKQVTEQHKELSKYITDRDQIKTNKESFDRQIEKLKAKQKRAEEKSEIKQSKLAKLQAKRQRYLEKQEYRKQLIQQEIDKIEREIEQIAKEEEIMWSEYRKAKEVAKQQKYEYYAKKREEKRIRKEERKQAKTKNKQEKTKTKKSNENKKDK